MNDKVFNLPGAQYEKSIPSRTFLILAVAFVTALMVSNLIAGKLISVGGLVLPAAVVLFPLAYQYSQSKAKEARR